MCIRQISELGPFTRIWQSLRMRDGLWFVFGVGQWFVPVDGGGPVLVVSSGGGLVVQWWWVLMVFLLLNFNSWGLVLSSK